MVKNDRFTPGRPWLDTDGNRIQAHGGSVLYYEGAYYWYGENKEFTDIPNRIWHWGIRMYRSIDLYNWDSLGIVIPPEPDDETSPLHPWAHMDRPHILYNERTRKFVAWIKVMEDGQQRESVLVADRLTGPYTLVRKFISPAGMSGGDFDLQIDESDQARIIFEHPHSEMIVADLTDDYLEVRPGFSRHFTGMAPPDAREAPAWFFRRGKWYLFTSGTTGKYPNRSLAAVADAPHGPYRVLGDPHPDDPTHTSFHSQISCVFRVRGKKDLFIAAADRWFPEHMDIPYESYAKVLREMFDPEATEGQREKAKDGLRFLPIENSAIADYVWLPVRFEGENVILDWKDEWRLSDYEDEEESQ